MNNLNFFKPGKSENAFYTKQKLRYTDRYGLQSKHNDGFYIYELDKKTNKHVRSWVEKNKD